MTDYAWKELLSRKPDHENPDHSNQQCDDPAKILRDDTKTKATISHSGKNGRPKRGGCRLPSDNLTKREINAKHGKEITMNLKKPYTWKELQVFSDDLKKTWLKHVLSEYQPTRSMLRVLLRVSNTTLGDILNRYHLHTNGRDVPYELRAERDRKWRYFCDGTIGIVRSDENAQEPAVSNETSDAQTDTIQIADSCVDDDADSSDTLIDGDQLSMSQTDEPAMTGVLVVNEDSRKLYAPTLYLNYQLVGPFESLQEKLIAALGSMAPLCPEGAPVTVQISVRNV